MNHGNVVFIVDDDQVLCKNTASYLAKQGFVTRAFFDTASLEAALLETRPDIILLDIMLPGESGLAFFRRLRSQADIKVIFVTALGEETDRVIGLELGAEDYLVKPFSLRELAARIRNALRRQDADDAWQTARRYLFDGWVLETKNRLLLNPQGQARVLSGAEFRLLRFFLENSGQLLTRETLFQIICQPASLANDQVLDMQISRLRACLGESARSPRLVLTSRGNGYIFTAAVQKDYGQI